MESSNFVKIAAAFVAGLVIALGSVLIYIKFSQAAHPTPVTQAAAPAPPPSAVPAPASLPDAGLDNTPPPVAEPTPEPVPPAVYPKKHVHAAPVPKVDQLAEPSDQPPSAEIAQTNPPLTSNYPSQVPAPSPNVEPPVAPPPAPAPRQPRTMTIEAGTALSIRLSQKLSSDQNYGGDTFRGTLETPIILNGAIIADRGSLVLGRIVNAHKAGRIEGVSDLSLTLTEINTTDGQHVTVQTNQVDRKGPTGVGGDAAKIAGGTALGAIIGAIAGGGKGAAIGAGAGGAAGTGTVLATRGKAAVFPVESRVEFHLASPVTITEHLN